MRWSILPLVSVFVGSGGCGDDGGSASTGSAETSGGSQTDTGVTSGSANSSGTTMASSTSASATSEETSGSTTDVSSSATEISGTTVVTSSSEGTTGTGDSSGTGEEGVVYTAFALIGGLDRVEIRKADYTGDLCMWLRLVHPTQGGKFPGVTTPAMWTVEQIGINDDASSCEQENPSMFGAEQATGATGSVSFGMLGQFGYPCALDIDVDAQFAGVLPDVPPNVSMTASDLVVEDAC